MAEASSSGPEGSDEEEEDESGSPSVAIVTVFESSSSREESSDEEENESSVAMAEASSSGGEGREEDEEHDEASKSLASRITAARYSPPAQRHTNQRMKLRYVQDYLLRVPKHQRRRIQKEIDKGYKPGETDCSSTYCSWVH
jgi:hypothetical protein